MVRGNILSALRDLAARAETRNVIDGPAMRTLIHDAGGAKVSRDQWNQLEILASTTTHLYDAYLRDSSSKRRLNDAIANLPIDGPLLTDEAKQALRAFIKKSATGRRGLAVAEAAVMLDEAIERAKLSPVMLPSPLDAVCYVGVQQKASTREAFVVVAKHPVFPDDRFPLAAIERECQAIFERAGCRNVRLRVTARPPIPVPPATRVIDEDGAEFVRYGSLTIRI